MNIRSLDLLQNGMAEHIALIDGDTDQALTYEQLHKQIEQIALMFGAKKSLVFLFIRPTLNCIATYLALLQQQHAIALFDDSLHPNLKKNLVDTYKPHYIFSEEDTHFHNYSKTQHLRHRNEINDSPKIHHDLQLLLSTSGTTGSPKLIRLSKKNIFSNASSIVEYLRITPKEKAIATLPLSYSYGLSVLHSHLLAGATTIVTSKSMVQEEFWNIIAKYKATSFAGVPYTYQLLYRLGFEGLLPSSIHTLTQAGGHLDTKLAIKIANYMSSHKRSFYIMYGQTEATARIAYLPPNMLPKKAGSIGIAIPGGTLQLFIDGAEIVQPNVEGELVYSGDNVMMGYAEGPQDLALGDVMHGKLFTGDIGYRDEDGFYFLTGRMKRISKVYGQRINLDEMERSLVSHGRVAAISDDVTIQLYFESSEVDFEECINHLSKLYHIAPTTFVCSHTTLPMTSSGKIDYAKLRKS